MAYSWSSICASLCLFVATGAMGFPLYGRRVVRLSCTEVKGTDLKLCTERSVAKHETPSNLLTKGFSTGLLPLIKPKRNNISSLVDFLSRRPSRRRIDTPRIQENRAKDDILQKLESFRILMENVKNTDSSHNMHKRPFDSINYSGNFGGFKR